MGELIRFGFHVDNPLKEEVMDNVDVLGLGAFQFFLGETNTYYPAIWPADQVKIFKSHYDGVVKVIHLPYIFNFATPKTTLWNL